MLGHPFVTGELAIGHLPRWKETIDALRRLLQARIATESEFLTLVSGEKLAATGLGFVDVHLLASSLLTPETRLWSRDKNLARYANRLGIGWVPD